MGQVDLEDVPAFARLLERVGQYKIVFIDLDETEPGSTPQHESRFVRELLEGAGVMVFNAFTDDGNVFREALEVRFGPQARPNEVVDSSDAVCFFPALASEITRTVLRKEIFDPPEAETDPRRKIEQRIESLRTLRPYSGGGKPFIEDRLGRDWQKRG